MCMPFLKLPYSSNFTFHRHQSTNLLHHHHLLQFIALCIHHRQSITHLSNNIVPIGIITNSPKIAHWVTSVKMEIESQSIWLLFLNYCLRFFKSSATLILLFGRHQNSCQVHYPRNTTGTPNASITWILLGMTLRTAGLSGIKSRIWSKTEPSRSSLRSHKVPTPIRYPSM